MDEFQKRTLVAIAWCLAYGDNIQPKHSQNKLEEFRQTILLGQSPDGSDLQSVFNQAQTLLSFTTSDFHGSESKTDFPKTTAALQQLITEYSELGNAQIGLVYGGVTKVKGYVFESADLQEIRGASALLDRINLVDLPAFFGCETSARFPQCQQASPYCQKNVRQDWLNLHFPGLSDALIPELIVYSTGGNILAFCPAAFVNQLADAIEKRYTTETLTANSCAVGDLFRPLEIYLGLLSKSGEQTLWLDTLSEHVHNPVLQAYFDFGENATQSELEGAFKRRKNFSELVGKLANQFNQRRSGCDASSLNTASSQPSRPSRRYPPMFETHPYGMRDDSDRRAAVVKIPDSQLPNEPTLSEPSARKRLVGQVAKRENFGASWYLGSRSVFRQQENGNRHLWQPGPVLSWINKFERFVADEGLAQQYDPDSQIFDSSDRRGDRARPVKAFKQQEARSLREIADASDGYIAYIYADGNNMGQYIRNEIKTPAQYQRFSKDVFDATEQSVYWALAHCIQPHRYTPDGKSSRKSKDPVWIHPFEIVTIGGDDVLLIVPANRALEVAKAIGQRFEAILTRSDQYLIPNASAGSSSASPHKGDIAQKSLIHRYRPESAATSNCRLSISSGVLITAANTPIYYADKLVSQLLKSSKKHAKKLKPYGYYGGTVDFLTLKAVTMISSNIEAFRDEGLSVRLRDRQQTLKLYAAPYTLHELGGLIETIRAIKVSGFPKSQLYQVRSLLEKGKRTAILNYRYFRVRLTKENQTLLETHFEQAWCKAETNVGNLAPWLTAIRKDDETIYETLWRELVELEPFINTESTVEGVGEPDNAGEPSLESQGARS